MNKKSVIVVASVVLNLVLFAALAHFNQINSRTEGIGAPFFRVQHLPEFGKIPGDSHGILLASTVK